MNKEDAERVFWDIPIGKTSGTAINKHKKESKKQIKQLLKTIKESKKIGGGSGD